MTRPPRSGAPAADWWRGAVIYQIYPRSFQDSNGDGIGDLRGITRRLGHVADLGVDAVWISPFFASPMKDFGYDVSDYQGEELGLPEADIAFEDLVDPYGIEFWPEYKGRDGCRTPMVWEADSPSGGFSAGKPWLPVPAEHLALAADRQRQDAASVLSSYREMLAFRRRHPALRLGSIEFLDAPPGVLAFVRRYLDEGLLCVFNVGDQPAALQLPANLRVADSAGRPLRRGSVAGSIVVDALSACFGVLT